jgi:multicomponent Na+:H+ antiporter subunit C
VLTNPQPLRKILAFNLIGNGVFLLFGAIARRGAAAGFGGDPVPHGLLITGIVVAFSATARSRAVAAAVPGDRHCHARRRSARQGGSR